MKASLILAHPNEKSLNHAIAGVVFETLENLGYEVYFHDLYKEQFDPLLPYLEISKNATLNTVIQQHCNEIALVDAIIIVHPNWWGQPPAILTGWVDRIIRPGVAYKFVEGDKGEGVPVGLLKAAHVLVFNTSDTPDEREMQVFGDPLQRIWKDCIFGLCGVKNFYRKTFNVVVTSTEEQRKAWLQEVQNTVCTVLG